jgi:SAM-dependent methyltransferase
MRSSWADMVESWRAYVPPCRPSRFELDLCTELIAGTHRRCNPPHVLVLGSTVEYRDWAFEEACRVTVVDASPEFHAAISADRRYKLAEETLVVARWEEMTFDREFDLVVGDHVVGNVAPEAVPALVANVRRALRPGGAFLTKSFFLREDRLLRPIDGALRDYELNHAGRDPFSILAYELTIHATDPESGMIDFARMYAVVEAAHRRGDISERTFARYRQFGWHQGATLAFHVMPMSAWETLLAKWFPTWRKHFGPYVWSRDVPVYVAIAEE